MKISEDRMQLDLANTHIAKLEEQLRLCNIDQLNAEQELTELREEREEWLRKARELDKRTDFGTYLKSGLEHIFSKELLTKTPEK